MRISDWSSDVCSSDLPGRPTGLLPIGIGVTTSDGFTQSKVQPENTVHALVDPAGLAPIAPIHCPSGWGRSEEHTSELQSLMRISYAVFCLKKKKKKNLNKTKHSLHNLDVRDNKLCQ